MQNFSIYSWLSISPETKGYVFYESDSENTEYKKFLSIEASELVGIYVDEESTESIFYINFTARINRKIISARIKSHNNILVRDGYKIFIAISCDWNLSLKMYYSVYPCEGTPELIEITDFKENFLGEGEEITFDNENISWGYLFNGEITYSEIDYIAETKENITTKMLDHIPECISLFEFISQPMSQSVNEGGTLNLTAQAIGRDDIVYIWYRDNYIQINDDERISGSTTPNLTITNFLETDVNTETDTSEYFCFAYSLSPSFASIESTHATITFNGSPPPPPSDLWYRSFSYSLGEGDLLSTATEIAVDSPFYPYVNKRMTLTGALTIEFDYNVLFNGGSNGWSIVRGVAVADYSDFKKDKSFNQIMNSTIGGFAGWSTGEFGWTYFTYGAPEAITQAYSANGIWGNPLHGTTLLEISALKMNGKRDITVHVIGKDSDENVLFDEEVVLTDRITGSDILVMTAGAGDVFYNDGSFSGNFLYI